MKVTAIVPAAGKGTRIRSNIYKPYIYLCGKPILAHTLLKLSGHRLISEIVVAVSKDEINTFSRKIVNRFCIGKIKVVTGGKERCDSVFNALENISSEVDFILIHDGVRPFITEDLIERSLKAAKQFGASVVAVPVKPTLKHVGKSGRIISTPDRSNFWEAQTPQVFRRDLIEKAYEKAKGKRINITDDSMLVEQLGIRPKIVMGDYRNIKITTREDLELAKVLLLTPHFRVGNSTGGSL